MVSLLQQHLNDLIQRDVAFLLNDTFTLPDLSMHWSYLQSQLQSQPELDFLDYNHHQTRNLAALQQSSHFNQRGKFSIPGMQGGYKIHWLKQKLDNESDCENKQCQCKSPVVKQDWCLLVYSASRVCPGEEKLQLISDHGCKLLEVGEQALEKLNFIRYGKH